MSNVKPVQQTSDKPDAANSLGRKAKKMNCHAGLILAGLAVTGLHHEKDHCDLTVTQLGVHVRLHKHLRREASELLVPWSNIYFVELM